MQAAAEKSNAFGVNGETENENSVSHTYKN